MQKELKSNIWKYFIFLLTTRRNYIAILSLYFLTLPNSTAQQIGLFTGIGWLAGFLFEIPSGYLSDILGHKKALVISKISLLFSTIAFIAGTNLWNFILGSIFISIAMSFTSGTQEAFLHNTLINLGKEEKFSKIYGKIQGNVSLVSAGMILALPFLTKISMVLPIEIYVIFDIIGILIALTLKTPKIHFTAEDEEGKNIITQIKKFKGTGFYATSFFFGFIGASMMALTSFNVPYAESLGLPIILAGAIMGLSRIFWFAIGHSLHALKKIKMRNLMAMEIGLFSILILINSITNSAYVFVIVAAFLTGYYNGRRPIINEYYFKKFLLSTKFKATMLSIKSQLTQIIQSILVFIVGLFMGLSFKLGYLITALFVFFSLLITYQIMKREGFV